jgi:superfamily I DNA/RNA helicase
VDDLIAKILLMFTDEMNGAMAQRVTLSTVHKFKGQEADVVFILDKTKYMPSRFATQPWQQTAGNELDLCCRDTEQR